MKVEILIVTHAKDLAYLRWALRSIGQYGRGFSYVTVLFPRTDANNPALEELFKAAETSHPIVRFKFFDEFKPKGMLDHEAQLLAADVHCPDADFVLHSDSDCIFREAFTPEDYFVEGKPVLLCEPYARLKTIHPGRFYWQSVVTEALGFEPTHECMCRPCPVYPRGLYQLFRDYMEERWRMPLRYYILTHKNEFPQSFCEYNSIGAFAMKFHPDMFHWVEVPKERRPKDKCVQFWSHSPPDQLQSIWVDDEIVSVLPELLIAELLGESTHDDLDKKV